MGKVKSILSVVVGLLLLGSLIGYSGQEIIPDVLGIPTDQIPEKTARFKSWYFNFTRRGDSQCKQADTAATAINVGNSQ